MGFGRGAPGSSDGVGDGLRRGDWRGIRERGVRQEGVVGEGVEERQQFFDFFG